MSEEILAKNIKYLCKKNKVKLTELEKMIGVSQGYLSRFARKDGQKLRGIPAYKLNELSLLMHISMDELWRRDFAKEAEKEELLSQIAEAQKKLASIEREQEAGEQCSPLQGKGKIKGTFRHT